jgi:hypothetical protein
MAVLTLPAAADADTSLKPVPWRQMLWVVWRQHRPTLIAVSAVYGAVTLYLVLMGLKIRRDFAALTACHPVTSNACGALANLFTGTDWHISNATLILMNLLPAFIGAFAGGPLLARDLETGAFRYMWTQGAGRVRSTIARLVLVGIFVSVLAGVVGQVFAWFFQPALQNAGMTVLTATVFVSRGLAFPAWTLAAFVIGAFCGMLLRRTLPAMAVALGAYTAVALLGYLVLRPRYPVALVTSNASLFGQVNHPGQPNGVSTNSLSGTFVPWVLKTWHTGATQWWRYIPVSRFWPMQSIEASWLVAASILLIAATVWLARHHAA